MTSWQKRLRIALAIFGIVFAGWVYRSIGERPVTTPAKPVDRLDPKAMVETTQAVLQQVRGTEQEFQIKSQRTLTYADGSAKHVQVEITVRKADGRVFVVTAGEALAGPNQVELQLSGGVKVSVNDGFELTTDHGTFNQNESIARAPGAVTFKKGHMSGSGSGATYNQKSDVLIITEHARVLVTDAGKASLDGTAGTATLDRVMDVLFMESAVHVLRGGQVIDAQKVMAGLSPDEDVVTHLELRGNASVQGGDGPLQSMKAEAIDLDYSDDGTSLERAILNGAASLSTAADEHTSARHMAGEGLDVQMAGDGTVSQIAGRGGVHLDLPAGEAMPLRGVSAKTFDASAKPGSGLDEIRFRNDVVYQEGGKSGAAAREVRAQSLSTSLAGDVLTEAFFSGGVTFEEQDLRAVAVEARYQPEQKLLNLYAGGGVRPHVNDDRIYVEADAIDVTLEGHDMTARGNVRTSLTGRSSASSDRSGEGGRLPKLLKEGQPASVNAERLEYGASTNRAEYRGNATLVQGDTAIRGDSIVIDQQKGDLLAAGSARSTLVLDAGRTDGRANDIRYDEARRTVTYSSEGIAPTTPQRATVPLAQVSGPDGDMRAERIEIVLAERENAVNRVEGYNRVTIVLGSRTASGSRLTYHAEEERYVMAGAGATPVSFRESCRETTGRTLTFFKSTDRIVVDGNETRRTETKPCTPPAAPAPVAAPQPKPSR
jgi:LPS export ABC transporter protein LptC